MDNSEIKRKLSEQIDRLSEQLPSLKESARPVAPDNSIGRISRMEAIGAQAINKKAYESAKSQLHRLEQLLAEVDSEDFATCIECEEPISIERLLVVPETRHCINCAKTALKRR